MYKNQYFSFPTKPQSPSSKPLLQAVFPSPKQKNSLTPSLPTLPQGKSAAALLFIFTSILKCD